MTSHFGGHRPPLQQNADLTLQRFNRTMPYIELHACSAFSFLRGGSFPEQLAEVAAELKMPAMALLDRNGVYGAQRFSVAAREHNVRAIIGCELSMEDGSILPALVENRIGYKNLCELLTQAHLRSEKGKCAVRWGELPQFAEGLVALFGSGSARVSRAGFGVARKQSFERFATRHEFRAFRKVHDGEDAPASTRDACATQNCADRAKLLINAFGRENIFVEVQRHFIRGEERVNRELIYLARAHRVPLIATNSVQYAKPYGREVLDVFTCIREHTHLDAAGKLLAQNAERHLKSDRQMRAIFADLPEAIENTSRLAERLTFSLENLGYEFPEYPVPAGHTMDSFLRTIVWFGAQQRYAAISAKVKRQIEEELALITKLGFPGYFLIVWDIVNFCREHNIMVQGRGSAANSAVCYCLGITPVDPVENHLVFERFLNESRKGWPDIDLDLPSGGRREAVIQEIYRRYGQHGAAMTANVISYRGRSAAREIGKALNFSPSIIDRFSHLFASGDFPHTMELEAQIEAAGLPKNHPRMPAFIRLYHAIYGLPRHLGQHSGGMIICQNKLSSFVPLENASMPGRVVAQWDKDDCEDLGIVKVDLLGLGMMSVMQDALELCRERGRPLDLAHIPKDDPATFEIMQHADTIGVFQIESRAQMATLPRMKPECFYDVVIEVAIIRPGPIQGDMVHPYLARRAGKEPITYYDERLKPVLQRTLGVPLFQEQMLKIAMVMADFSGDEAEELRRALSFHRSEERMNKVSVKLRAAMERKGVAPDKIEKIVQSISSFALYGFPESHAISFAILAYGSAYLKVHRAPEFYASLLNNQPMGFYTSATIVKDAQRHGVKVKTVCVMKSDWRCTVADDNTFRLGLCVVNGLREEHSEELVRQRQDRQFESLEDFKRRAPLTKNELRTLAELGALNCFAEHRRAAMWDVEEAVHDDLLTNHVSHPERSEGPLLRSFDYATYREYSITLCEVPRSARDDGAKRSAFSSPLAAMTLPERVRADYETMNLTTGPHPMKLLRESLPNIWRAIDLVHARHGSTIQIAGNVICRQRPGTAKGFVFISLEDETGVSNAIVEPDLFEHFRLVITEEAFLLIEGEVQNSDNVILIKARDIRPLAHEQLIGSESHDFH
ncbi:MAG TPA: error-prone DNA polymerase [Candidatus Udaeobacter sp.]|nr:error-prone DNA polymerase [Candidatus Udaeobacter sp.]